MSIALQQFNNGIYPGPLTDNPSYTGPVVGQECKITLFATGGTPPYTFSVVSGTLPNGLSIFKDTRFTSTISRDFIIGTPTLQGPYVGQGVGFPTYSGLTKFQLFNFTLHIVDSLSASANVICSILVYEKQAVSMCLPPLIFGQEYNFQLNSDYINDVFTSLNNAFSQSLTPKIPYELSLSGFYNDAELVLMGLTLSSSGLLHVPVQTLYHSLPSPLSRSPIIGIQIKDSGNNNQTFQYPVIYVDVEYVVYPLVANLAVGTPAIVDWETNIGTDNRFLTLISGALPAGITIVTTSSSDFEGIPTIPGIYFFVFEGQMAYGLTNQANGKMIVTGNGSACDCAEDLTYLKTYL